MVNVNLSQSEVVNGGPKYGSLSTIAPEFQCLKAETDANFIALWKMDLEAFKTAWKTTPPALPSNCPMPGVDITITDSSVKVRDGAEIPIRTYESTKKQSNCVLYLKAHGGGWVVGGHEVEEAENRFVAAIPGVIVVSVDYRMAPEFKFPYAINDCFDVLQWCKKNFREVGINPEKIIVAGGSAGGNIAAVLAQMARDEKVSGVIGQVLNIPVTCHPKFFPSKTYEYFSYSQNKDSSVIDAPRMDWFWDQYMPEPKLDVYASPLLAKTLEGLPQALVQVAGMDPLRDEGLAYAEKLQADGVKVGVKTFQGLPHGFYMFPQLKATGEYYNNVITFVKSCISSSD